jgi:hypothetical protein
MALKWEETMKYKKVIKYGHEVIQNSVTDKIRKTECMCLNCKDLDVCNIAHEMYELCKEFNCAVMMTRCKYFEEK